MKIIFYSIKTVKFKTIDLVSSIKTIYFQKVAYPFNAHAENLPTFLYIYRLILTYQVLSAIESRLWNNDFHVIELSSF